MGGQAPAPLVLASASLWRRDLLEQIGLRPDLIASSDLTEALRAGELPPAYAKRMAAEKLTAAQARHAGAWVLAADTVVALGRRVLPKTEDRATAEDCLRSLSGRRHRVLGAIALQAPDGKTAQRLVTTRVAFKQLSAAERRAYLDSGEWAGKAGGYAIQGLAAAFIPWINGSYSNVVGLPLPETWALFSGLGYPIAR
ncbi:MAG: septum formation protein Maf [Rhodospirillales bacterium]|nr:septum formation protein Maf [Rhodospirillales bacterium]